MFKTIYTSTHRLALTILATLLLATTTAVAAVNMLGAQPAPCEPMPPTLGRFVVTPDATHFVAPSETSPTLGRFVVTPSRTRYIASGETETSANL